jgi:endonuclease YncB( thermonuclease family)
MSQNKRQTALLFSLLALLILIGLQLLRHRPEVITRKQQPLYSVERVVDGDTIIVKSIGKVRYRHQYAGNPPSDQRCGVLRPGSLRRLFSNFTTQNQNRRKRTLGKPDRIHKTDYSYK